MVMLRASRAWPALLLALGAAAHAQTLRVVSLQALPVPSVVRGATHDLRLSLYGFTGTRWVVAEIAAAVLEASSLLAQCGVALAGVDLRMLEAPRRFHFYATPVSRALLRELTVPRPAIFFVEDSRNDPAFDAEAIGRGNAATRPELADTVWVAHGARDLAIALAHELVHLLSDSGAHSDTPGNLMRADTAPGNDRLTGEQCRRMRERGAANGLLVPRDATAPTDGK